MDLLLSENRPETCGAVGLECGLCTRKAAASVARICTGLQPHGIQQLFLQLFPSPGCRPMAQAFELAYGESSGFGTTARAAAAAA
jgi:hypothetical protein